MVAVFASERSLVDCEAVNERCCIPAGNGWSFTPTLCQEGVKRGREMVGR